MKRDNAFYAAAISFLAIVLLGAVFWEFTLANVLRPAARVVWLFLRYTILRADQLAIWQTAIAACAIAILFSISRAADGPKPEAPSGDGFYSGRHRRWKSYFIGKAQDSFNQENLKKELRKLLITAYAVRKRASIDYQLTEAFRDGSIELPRNVYRFLFSREGEKGLRLFLRKLWHALSGTGAAEYRRELDEVLAYMENYMERENEYYGAE